MPLSDEEIRSLLLKYIAEEMDESEKEEVEKWLMQHPEAFEEFEQLWDLWHTINTVTSDSQFDVDKGWEETWSKMRKKDNGRRRKKRLKSIFIWGSVAAVVIVVVAFSFLGNGMMGEFFPGLGSKKITLRDTEKVFTKYDTETQTLPGKRQRVSLPDGSTVWLNGGTKIHFIMNEKQGTRKLTLNGQAFFDIADRKNMPFIVNTGHASIKVLGTRFNVTAYADDSTVETVLTSGRILFESKSGEKKVEQRIDPGQKIAVNYLSGEVNVSKVDTAFYSSWKEGKLVFNNQKFKEIANALEHKYNVEIIFKDKTLINKRINGYLQRENLKEALTALKMTMQFQYKKSGRKVYIY